MLTYEIAKDFAGPAAAVIGALAATGVVVAFGRIQASIARTQATTAAVTLQTAQRRLALDLFDKRSETVEQIRQAVGVVTTSGKVSREDHQKLLTAMVRAEFLFGPEVTAYLKTLDEAFFKHWLAHETVHSTEAERINKAEAAFATFQDFYQTFDRLLVPYMAMHDRLPEPKKPSAN